MGQLVSINSDSEDGYFNTHLGLYWKITTMLDS